MVSANSPVFDPITLYVLLVIFIATLIRSTLGFGEALVAVPLLALRTPVAIAAPLAVAVSVLVAGMVVVQDWHKIQTRSALWLILSTLLGIPLGLLLLARVDDHLVKSILGAIIICFSLYSLCAPTTLHLRRDHFTLLLGSGFLAGILGGAYGMNGPPLVLYGALRRWSPQSFRATLQGYFLPASLVGLIGYAILGLWSRPVTRYFLLSLPGILLGTVLGRAINHRLRSDRFFRVIYLGLIVTGAVLVAQAIDH
jgi:uncharacterized membrane protein YfcA